MTGPATDLLAIEGGHPLRGSVRIAGAKNAALPILAATLCAPGRHILHNCPDLLDVRIFFQVLQALGATIESLGPDSFAVDTSSVTCQHPAPPKELISQMRASVLVIGPLLGRCRKAEVALPGGCSLGPRPIDYHLAGFQALGGALVPINGTMGIEAPQGLRGADFTLPFPSVGATENLLMAAVLASGTTTLHNAAREPEVSDLGDFLIAMGARIRGLGEATIVIEGGHPLHAVEYSIIPDRIEAGSFLCALANTAGRGTITHCIADHLTDLLRTLDAAGCELGIERGPAYDAISLTAPDRLRAVGIRTAPYPGFATDHQPLWMACLTTAESPSGFEIVLETLFESRFNQVEPLRAMGAEIEVLSQVACVRQVPALHGATIAATDIRGGMGLVVAALRADGTTQITQLHHLMRGYADLLPKLHALGAIAELTLAAPNPKPAPAPVG